MYNYVPWISMNTNHYHSDKGIMMGSLLDGSPVSIPVEDLMGHMIIAGKTGTGKSVFVGQMAHEISKRKDCNIILLDPHGKLARNFVGGNKMKKLVYISPRTKTLDGKEYCIQLNGINTSSTGTDPENSLGWVRELFSRESSVSSNTWGPRLGFIFRTLLTEMVRQERDSTLRDLARLLENPSQLRLLLERTQDASTRDFILMQMKDWRNWNEYVSSALNKLVPLISSRSVSPLISSRRDSLNLREAIEKGNHAFVIEISKNSMPEDTSRIITSIFLQRFWSEYLSLRKPVETYVIVDECQLVESSIIEKLLGEGRKYGLRLILVTQSLTSFTELRRNSILSNVRNFVIFNVSDEDSRLLSGTVSLGRKDRTLSYVIKNQRVHDTVIWSQGDTGLSGPMSFRPGMIKETAETEFDEAVDRSILEFGSHIEADDNLEPVTSRHDHLIYRFGKYLAGKNVLLATGKKVNGMLPDGLFTFNATEYILEAECSDLENVYRIFHKIKSYPNRKIVFICYAEDATKLFNLLVTGFTSRWRGNLVMEVPVYRGNDTIYFRDISDYLERIYLIAVDGEEIRYFYGKKLKRFSMSSFNGHGSFMDSLAEEKHGELKLLLYREMVKSRLPFLSTEDISKGDFTDGRKIFDFLGKIANKPLILMQDIFETG
ncbi:MAG: type IV secretion system DNA-binding domain-containing protein [Thermoplasmataceae archaeon]